MEIIKQKDMQQPWHYRTVAHIAEEKKQFLSKQTMKKKQHSYQSDGSLVTIVSQLHVPRLQGT